MNAVFNGLRKIWAGNGRLKFIIVALGIFCSYFIVGILQERTMRVCYSDERDDKGKCKDADTFKYAVTIALVQNFLAFIIIRSKLCLFIKIVLENPIKITQSLVFFIYLFLTNRSVIYLK